MSTDPTATPEYQARKKAEFDELGVPEDSPEWRSRVRVARSTLSVFLDSTEGQALPHYVRGAASVLMSDALHRRPVPLWVDEQPLSAKGRGWWPTVETDPEENL